MRDLRPYDIVVLTWKGISANGNFAEIHIVKYVKHIIGFIAFVFFFLLIDPSGVGFKPHMKRISSWAKGESKRLRFEAAK